MKRVNEAIKFAWQETGKYDASIADRGVMFAGALGRIAHMRTYLTLESIFNDEYIPVTESTEEYHISNTISNVANLTNVTKTSEN